MVGPIHMVVHNESKASGVTRMIYLSILKTTNPNLISPFLHGQNFFQVCVIVSACNEVRGTIFILRSRGFLINVLSENK